MNSLRLACLVGAVLTSPAAAQTTHSLVGSVIDSATGRTIDHGTVLVPELGLTARVDEEGRFAVPGVPQGTYELSLRAPGYRSRSFRFDLGPGHEAVVRLGVVMLAPGADPVMRVVGTVRSVKGYELSGARVALDGRPPVDVDPEGRFRLDPVAAGAHTLQVHRIGFRPARLFLTLTADRPEATLDVELEELPFQLEPITVEADRVVYIRPRMREFYRRRQRGLGTFFTPWEIERYRPFVTTDMFRRVLGFRVTPGRYGTNRISTTRGIQCSTPLVYLDGFRIPASEIDLWVHPDDVAGIEAYPGTASAPFEYSRGTGCGVVVIWTR